MEMGRMMTAFLIITLFLTSALGVGGPTFGCISVYVYIWIHDFGLTHAQAGWISAALNLFFQVLGPVYSLLVSLMGVWKTQLLAAFISTLGIVCTGFSSQFWQILLSYAVVAGFGCSLTRLITYSIINDHFREQRNKVYAVSYAGYSFGQFVCPILVDYLKRRVKYQNALLIQAALIIGVLIAATIVYRWIDGATNVEMNGLLNSNNTEQAIQGPEAEPSGGTESSEQPTVFEKLKHESKTHLKVLKNLFFILALFSYLLAGISATTFYTFVIELAVHSGYATSTQGAIGSTITGIATLVAAFTLTILMKFNKQPIIFQTLTVFFAGVINLCLTAVHSLVPYYILCFLSGFNGSMLYSNIMSHAQTFGHEKVDTRLAYVIAVAGIGYAVGPIMGGSVIKPLGITAAFYLGGGCAILGALLTIPSVVKSISELIKKRQCAAPS